LGNGEVGRALKMDSVPANGLKAWRCEPHESAAHRGGGRESGRVKPSASFYPDAGGHYDRERK